MIGTSDSWSMRRSSHQPINPAYYIEDCRISGGADKLVMSSSWNFSARAEPSYEGTEPSRAGALQFPS